MFPFLKRSLYILSNKIRRWLKPDKTAEEKWITDFSKAEKIPFDIKTESSYDAYRENGPLCLSLKKTGSIAWLEAPERRFRDQIIEAKLRLDSLGGYAAAGLMFRIADRSNYYLALVSSKGYFRLDLMKNDSLLPLIGWTEVPDSAMQAEGVGQDILLTINLTAAACGDHLIFLTGGQWIAETYDTALTEGHIGFALASYETGVKQTGSIFANTVRTCRSWLDFLSVDSRNKSVEEFRRKWDNSLAIPAESRFHLAETFAALGAASAALTQLTRAWNQREEAARSVTATYTETRTRKELLLAARMALRLERYDEAEEYLNACLELGDGPGEEAAAAEKMKLLDKLEKYTELKNYIIKYISKKNDKKNDPALRALLGRTHWNLKEYEKAAAAWDRAFELDKENGSYAVNAANAYMFLGKNSEALKRCLEGGRVFLRQDNNEELGALIPRLLSLGERDWEARALVGKWAFGIGDYERSESELVLAENLRRKSSPQPAVDPAVSYLRALLLIRKGKRREGFRFLTEAARLAPDYGLFRFKLAENRYILTGNARAPGLAADLQAALRLMGDDGWVHNFAAQIRLAAGAPKPADLEAAEQHLQKAAAALGEIPAVRVNLGTLRYLRGDLTGALKILSDNGDDSEGLTAHCAGKLLFRSGDFERADTFYRRALAAAPDNLEYLSDRVDCLAALKLFDTAEELLARARNRNSSPAIPELINRLAAQKKAALPVKAAGKPPKT
ncbi:MAG: tetratricopeptide repeat protein [Treponema sp.]|jgi:tetratricopeptide (TPR) repeat protein|nr:tetratricopeptide repeat protein [Treponema sp.]